MEDSGLATAMLDDRKVGIYVGTGFGNTCTIEASYSRFFQSLYDPSGQKNPVVAHPLTVPRIMANAAAAAISEEWGIHGPSQTYCVACASSAVAFGEAWRSVRHNYLDAAIVVGSEAMLSPGSFTAWNALRVMAKPDHLDIAMSCKPFDINR